MNAFFTKRLTLYMIHLYYIKALKKNKSLTWNCNFLQHKLVFLWARFQGVPAENKSIDLSRSIVVTYSNVTMVTKI